MERQRQATPETVWRERLGPEKERERRPKVFSLVRGGERRLVVGNTRSETDRLRAASDQDDSRT